MSAPALSSGERIRRAFAHQDADRVPIVEGPWSSTLERWQREGLPADVDYADFFDVDSIRYLHADNGPRFPERVIEQTDEYIISYSSWGVTMKRWRHAASTPEFLDFDIKGRDDWRKIQARFAFDRSRVNWDQLARDHARWRARDDYIMAHGWFGFDITHSWFLGTEQVLIALADEPDWLAEVFQTELDLHLKLYDAIWDAGYRFDGIRWPDDMGYKHHQFFGLSTYRQLLKPIHQRAIEWAHAKGIKACLHSCGNINPFIPELLEMKLDGLNPIEVKAGMDPLTLKRDHGDRLLLHGGISALVWNDGRDAMAAEVQRVLPTLAAGGGYIFATDHSVPDCVSLADFRAIVELAKRLTANG